MTARLAAVRLTPNDRQAARLKALGVLGYRKDGRPIYPIGGGEGDDGDGGSGDDGGDSGEGDAGDQGDDAGDQGDGKKGGDGGTDDDDDVDWKAKSRHWEQRAKSNKAAADELAKLRRSQQTDTERAVAEATDKVRNDLNLERVSDKLEAAAAGKFIDDDAAVALLSRDRSQFIDDGNVDGEAIKRAVAKLLKDKPHLAKDASRPKGDIDQGKKGGSGGKAATLEDAIKSRIAGQFSASR